MFANEIEKRICGTFRSKVSDCMMLYCQAYDALEAGSRRYTTTKAEAEIELRKPVLSKIQIITDVDSGLTTILADVLLPFEQLIFENERLFVGDERPDLRLKIVEVMGNNLAIKVQYLETGDEWIIER